MGAAAVILPAAALFLCWWEGLFLPTRIEWCEKEFAYYDTQVQLEDRRMRLSAAAEGKSAALTADQERNENNAGSRQPVFQTDWDWCVQDVLCYDINGDGQEELILLVWKHGSYGDHLPLWVERNDIRLEQHIFIYQWDADRENRLRPVWMSSALGYEVASIARGAKDSLIVTDRAGVSMQWQWLDFGLKLAGEAKEERVSFLCVGDNLIHPWILRYGRENRNYDYFYEHIKEKVEQADLASVNQETVFVRDDGLISDYPRFGTPIEVGEAIVDAGFDIVTLATNHALDKGAYGIDVTTAFYEEQEGVTYIGVHPSDEAAATPETSVRWIEKNGIRFALLNATYGTNGLPSPKEHPYMVERFRDEDRLTAQLDYARARADVVVMYAHWGTEYSPDVDEEQQRICDLLLEHGVDVVIGTHPHVLQDYGFVVSGGSDGYGALQTAKNGHRMLVYYSLGNLISGQNREECLIGGLAEFTVVKSPAGEVTIEDAVLEKVITHQGDDTCTVYLQQDAAGKTDEN